MSKIDEVRKAMMDAMKAGDKPRKEALSMLLSALKSKQIDKRADLTPEEENAIVYKEIKECQETIDTTPATCTKIIDECKMQMQVYGEFAPARMTEDEVRAAIEGTLAELGLTEPTVKEKGKLMKALMPRLGGKADGGMVNRIVSEYLK